MMRESGSDRFVTLCWALTLLLLVTFKCPAQADREYTRGIAAFRAGDYASAADLFAKADSAAPGTTDALIHQAKSLVHLQDFAAAEGALRRYIALHAGSDEALEAYRRAIEWQEGSPRRSEQPYLNLGSLLLELDRGGEAIASLEKAVELGANNANCHLKLGMAYLRANQLADAQRELEKAERIEPENAAIHYQLARVYKQTHQMNKAKAEFQRTEELQGRAARSRPSVPAEP